jgi:HK97 family phage portal protein
MNLWQRIKAAWQPLPWQDRVYVPRAQAGVLVTPDTALTFSAFWACVRVISQTIAALPWGVYMRNAGGREQQDSQIAWLLNSRPNPEMTAFSFREALIAHALAWGNGYAEIVEDMAGRVVELWPLLPDRVLPERNPETGLLQYRVTELSGETITLPADRVLHVHGLGFDGVTGYSLVRLAARSIGLGMAQETFAQSFYANGAVYGTLVEMPVKSMSPDQIEEAERYINDRNAGPGKAFKTKVVPLGAVPHNLTMPLQDAQFIEARKLSVTEMARLTGIPPHKIADLDRSTNNNIEHQGIEFVTDCIVPWCTRLEQETNVKLFAPRMQGRVYTKLDVRSLLRGDSKSRAEFYKIMNQIGVLSINEIRALEDMNGIGAAGDARLVQLNQTTLEWLVDNPEGQKAAAAEPTPQQADDTRVDSPAPATTNVIRAQALAWLREQKRQA